MGRSTRSGVLHESAPAATAEEITAAVPTTHAVRRAIFRQGRISGCMMTLWLRENSVAWVQRAEVRLLLWRSCM